MTSYTFYADPGHGWLQVQRSELRRLGIKPTSSSYQRGSFVYLEEDVDMTAFLRAKEAKGEAFELNEVTSNNSSQIRGFDSYHG